MADAYLNVALVTCCIICLSNKVKYLPKEEGKKKITKEVVLSLLNNLCNA